MSYDRIVISSGHGLYVRGASGIMDEVDEARIFVDYLANALRNRGVTVKTYHDDVSKTQDENLHRIVDFHNAQKRELDISCHFNAYDTHAHGTEVCYLTQEKLAAQLSESISTAGEFTDRGAKYRDGLYFLNQTSAASVLLEICFCDNVSDCELYKQNFTDVADAVADLLSGQEDESVSPPPSKPAEETVMGTCSWFGGPDDEGVSPSEGLAFIYEITEENQFLFLPFQPEGTTGLARRLNPRIHYAAMRFDYSVHPKETLLSKTILVRNIKTGFALTCTPADWGPHEEKTGRVIDLSPSMMVDLELETDDIVEVIFPYEAG